MFTKLTPVATLTTTVSVLTSATPKIIRTVLKKLFYRNNP